MLVFGIFATGFVLAEDSTVSGSSQSSVDVATPIAVEEIDGSIDDSVALTQCKRAGFAAFSGFTGGLVGNSQGYLTNIALVTSKVVCASGDMTVAVGHMKMGDSQMYRLIEKNVDGNSYVLYVLPKETKLKSIDEIESKSVGKLTLTLKDDYPQLRSYTAKLELTSGAQTGSWEGMFYANREVSIRKAEIKETESRSGKDGAIRPMPAEQVRAANAQEVKAQVRGDVTVAKEARQVSNARLHWWQFWKPRAVEVQADATAQVAAQ